MCIEITHSFRIKYKYNGTRIRLCRFRQGQLGQNNQHVNSLTMCYTVQFPATGEIKKNPLEDRNYARRSLPTLIQQLAAPASLALPTAADEPSPPPWRLSAPALGGRAIALPNYLPALPAPAPAVGRRHAAEGAIAPTGRKFRQVVGLAVGPSLQHRGLPAPGTPRSARRRQEAWRRGGERGARRADPTPCATPPARLPRVRPPSPGEGRGPAPRRPGDPGNFAGEMHGHPAAR